MLVWEVMEHTVRWNWILFIDSVLWILSDVDFNTYQYFDALDSL